MEREKHQEMEEYSDEMSFEELLEASFVAPRKLVPGEKLGARVVKVTPEFVFFESGGKSEGCLDARELLDENGEMTVKEGDTIHVYFLPGEGGEKRFTTKIGGGSGEAAKAQLEEAWRSGIPVEGSVEKEIKGGFEVKIAGSVRAFCPYSQMGLTRVENPQEFIGSQLSFKVTEFGEKGRNVIVSHRAILEEKLKEQKEALKKSLTEGMLVRGKVTSIRNFGAFVDIGGIEGLLPISEISWGRIEEVGDHLKVGQEVEVMIRSLDWEKERYSFSLKNTLPDPWDSILQNFPQGTRHAGKVVRLTNFGAFVTLADGVDGLLHISRIGRGKRVNHPREVLSLGQEVAVKVDSLDPDNKRLSLSFADPEGEDDLEEAPQDLSLYQNRGEVSMGTLGDLLQSKKRGNRGNKKK